MKCKRCDKPLLLKSEQEIALCLTCQQVLSRPKLFETHEPQYFIDDLYCLDDLPQPCPSRPSPTAPSPSSFSPQTITPPAKGGVVGLFFSLVVTLTFTTFAIVHLRPHLEGLDSFDLLVIAACVLLWKLVFKEVEKNVKQTIGR